MTALPFTIALGIGIGAPWFVLVLMGIPLAIFVLGLISNPALTSAADTDDATSA